MRVTSQTLPNTLTGNLQRLSQEQYRLQNQAATGKRTADLVEDTSAVRQLMTIQADDQAVQQYQRTAAAAHETTNENFRVVRALKTLSDRAAELAIRVDPLSGPDVMVNYATEIDQILEEALTHANTKFGESFLFAGTRSGAPPYQANKDAEGRIQSVEYVGNQSLTDAEIAPETRVSTRIIGSNAGPDGPPGLFADQTQGADFFAHLIALRNHLLAGELDQIQQQDVKALAADEDNFLFHLSATGSTQARIESTESRLRNRATQLAEQKSSLVDADLAETIVSLNRAQTAYQAALQTGAQMLRSSLMDYLR